MTEEQLRALVQEVVTARLAAPGGSPASSRTPPGDGCHASHLRLRVLPGAESGGPCLIEPAVRCNLCGYCQSLGH